LKLKGEVESRVELLRTWKEYEETHGTEAGLKTVEGMMPWQVTSFGQKDGAGDGEHETYKTWVFPDDQREQSSISKFLANAHKWKMGGAGSATNPTSSGAGEGGEISVPAVERVEQMAVEGDEEGSSGGEE